MLDGTIKTVMVDDSKIVSDMLMTICARIGQHVTFLFLVPHFARLKIDIVACIMHYF